MPGHRSLLATHIRSATPDQRPTPRNKSATPAGSAATVPDPRPPARRSSYPDHPGTYSCSATPMRRAAPDQRPNPPRNQSAGPAAVPQRSPEPAPVCAAQQLSGPPGHRFLLRHAGAARRRTKPESTPERVGDTGRQCRNGPQPRTRLRGAAAIRTTRAPIPAPPRRCGATTDQARIHPGTTRPDQPAVPLQSERTPACAAQQLSGPPGHDYCSATPTRRAAPTNTPTHPGTSRPNQPAVPQRSPIPHRPARRSTNPGRPGANSCSAAPVR